MRNQLIVKYRRSQLKLLIEIKQNKKNIIEKDNQLNLLNLRNQIANILLVKRSHVCR